MGGVVQVARRVRDRASAWPPARAVAIPSWPAPRGRSNQPNGARRSRPTQPAAEPRNVVSLPGCRRAAARRRLRGIALSIRSAAERHMPLRLPRLGRRRDAARASATASARHAPAGPPARASDLSPRLPATASERCSSPTVFGTQDLCAPLIKTKTLRLAGLSLKRMKGLEPSTFCMASRRSSQLSYIRSEEAS